MLSQTAEYALRAVVFLAGTEQRPSTISAIAGATGVPAGYLSKVLQTLRRAGLVRSRRGKNGGFDLNGAPEQITVYDVVLAVQAPPRLEGCPDSVRQHCPLHDVGACDGTSAMCPLYRALRTVQHGMEQSYRGLTLSAVLSGNRAGPTVDPA